MTKKKLIFSFAILILMIFGACSLGFIMYSHFSSSHFAQKDMVYEAQSSSKPIATTGSKSTDLATVNAQEQLAQAFSNSSSSSISDLTSTDTTRINSSTNIVYKYYYADDGTTDSSEMIAPNYLINMTKDQVAELYTDWTVESFSENQVVLKKVMSKGTSQNYIIGSKDGYIAVFYDHEKNGTNLKELTTTPVESLPESEQKRIAEGIKITGEDNLIKALQDYES